MSRIDDAKVAEILGWHWVLIPTPFGGHHTALFPPNDDGGYEVIDAPRPNEIDERMLYWMSVPEYTTAAGDDHMVLGWAKENLGDDALAAYLFEVQRRVLSRLPEIPSNPITRASALLQNMQVGDLSMSLLAMKDRGLL